MPKKNYIFLRIIFVLMVICYNIPTAYAQSWEDYRDIYIVKPPEPEGGTFYVKKIETNNNENKRFEPEGYLPTMTLIKVVRDEKGNLKREWITEESGSKYLYYEFTGSDGSHGYVKGNSIISLRNLFQGKGQSPPKADWKLIVPISPTNDVEIYNPPQNKYILPNKVVYKFSRSKPDIVLTHEETVDYFDEGKGIEITCYKLRFFRNSKKGDDGLIEVGKEGSNYRIFPISPGSYKEITIIHEGQGIIGMVKRFIKAFSNKGDAIDKLKSVSNKTCNIEIEIDVELKASANIPFLFSPIGGTGSLKGKIIFPKGFRYAFDRYHGFISDSNDTQKEVEVMKEIRCEEGSNTDYYTNKLTVLGIGTHKSTFQVFQHQLKDNFSQYFKNPDTTGNPDIKQEKMVALKPRKDYFRVFADLDNYLDRKFFNKEKLDLGPVKKQQYKNFIIRLVVDCRR